MNNRANNEYGYQPKHLKENNSPMANFMKENGDRIFYIIILLSVTAFTIFLADECKKIHDVQIEEPTYVETVPYTDLFNYTAVTIEEPAYVKTVQYTLEASVVSSSSNIFCDCEFEDVQTIDQMIGQDIIDFNGSTLVRYDLPDVYYPGLDYSSFQPYMPYTAITNKATQAYKVVRSDNCYTDEYGLRRYRTDDSQFTINGQDDYIIALGTFYKEKGTAGSRYLIVTTTGMYTAITGDEKADQHTDARGMFSMHCGNTKAGLIEWIVDKSALNSTIKRMGTVTAGGPEAVRGEILHIYRIN